MNTSISLIKSLAKTLLLEVDSLDYDDEDLGTDKAFSLNEKLQEFEIKLIKTALIKTRGNQRQAARLLGIPKSTLNNKIKIYNIQFSNSSLNVLGKL